MKTKGAPVLRNVREEGADSEREKTDENIVITRGEKTLCFTFEINTKN